METSTRSIPEQSKKMVPHLRILCRQELVTRVIKGNSILPKGKEDDQVCLGIVGQLTVLAIRQLVEPNYKQGRVDSRSLVNVIQVIASDELACAWIVRQEELKILLKIPNKSLHLVKTTDGNPNYVGFLEYVEKKKKQMKIKTAPLMSTSTPTSQLMSEKEYLETIPYGYDVFDWLDRGHSLGLIAKENKTSHIHQHHLKSFEDYIYERKGMTYCASIGYIWPHHLQLIKDVKQERPEMTFYEAWSHLINQQQIDLSDYNFYNEGENTNVCGESGDFRSQPQKIYIEADEKEKLEIEKKITQEKEKQTQLRKQKEIEKIKFQRQQEKQKKKAQQSLAAVRARARAKQKPKPKPNPNPNPKPKPKPKPNGKRK